MSHAKKKKERSSFGDYAMLLFVFASVYKEVIPSSNPIGSGLDGWMGGWRVGYTDDHLAQVVLIPAITILLNIITSPVLFR